MAISHKLEITAAIDCCQPRAIQIRSVYICKSLAERTDVRRTRSRTRGSKHEDDDLVRQRRNERLVMSLIVDDCMLTRDELHEYDLYEVLGVEW